MTHPEREIRAYYSDIFIRVYQAYSDPIADAALEKQTFTAPTFKVSRMTWIKPSFLWMMYRAGWGHKDPFQKRILAIDLTHAGFLWALEHSCPASFDKKRFSDHEAWKRRKAASPVRIQWDPERDLHLNRLDHRAIQIGLKGEAVQRYTEEWIVAITEVTELAGEIRQAVADGELEEARALLPVEKAYPVADDIARIIGTG